MTLRLIRPTLSIWRVRDCSADSDVEYNGIAFFRSHEEAQRIAEKAEEQFGWPFVAKRYLLEPEDGGR